MTTTYLIGLLIFYLKMLLLPIGSALLGVVGWLSSKKFFAVLSKMGRGII